MLAVHLMKYPVGLQITPLGDKFGLNPPAGGFVEPWVRDLFRDYLLPATRDALQAISDTDQGALDMAAWLNDHEDFSEDDWHAQIETQDRWMIEHGGYENWASVHAQTDEHIRANGSADELPPRIAYRERPRDWAAAEGTLTQESAMEAMRRRTEAEPSIDG